MWGFLHKIHLHDRLLDHLVDALDFAEVERLFGHLDGILKEAVVQVSQDLEAYATRDPASAGREDVILEAYASFKAVLYYRLAHQIWTLEDGLGGLREIIAHKLTNKGKIASGVEIHPAVRIGRRFVLDHAYGTVIGETCEIGDDCYILSGVTLGASGIANNPETKRHPTLGNNVEVGAGVRILGPVRIGDNVFISPSCVITQDIPANSKVSIVNQVQTLKHGDPAERTGFYSAFAVSDRLFLLGEKLEFNDISVVDADHQALPFLAMDRASQDKNHIEYRLRWDALGMDGPINFPLNLRISSALQEVTLLSPPGLDALVRSVVDPRIPTIGG
ncbi:serine acetyltransferase [Pseudomonas sp. PIC25]|uniref:serine O-acetyltransferase n=1 Tax=Pseudomonas sp. PIC25 TaxID=1958773 RepID=UPI000BABB49A|nr:serine O-acetyltransferase [Pseudomonas sp. PIC25]PAU51204.1 serine acetyltransferase [Pseudomonas sp. PIC25]